MAWTPGRRIAFRFGFLLAALIVFPFPLGALPWTERLHGLLTAPLEWLTRWTATNVLGLGEISTQSTGSGDTTALYVQYLVIAILATIGTIVWSVLDRKRTAYPQLAAGVTIVLRYYLAFTLLGYAVAKLAQFPPPNPTRLDQRVGDMSPMGLLWTFMGTSQPYTLFAGFVEGVPSILLLWRRTYVAGALLAAMAMGNVVALNFSYDVPVKLFSTQLFLIAVVLLLPHARRLISALLGRSTPEIPLRPRRALPVERARLAAKAMLLAAVALSLYLQVDEALAWRRPPRHELYGIWVVDKYVTNGVERPPLLTDTERWHKLHLWGRGASVRPMQGPVVRFEVMIDPARHTIAAKSAGRVELWTYTPGAADAERGEPTTLVIDGLLDGRPFHAELHREPEPLLVTRGFHWISEVPYNR